MKITDPDGVMAETEKSRGNNTVSIEVPFCDGVFRASVETPNDKIAIDVFGLMAKLMGLEFDMAVRKGGD